MGGYFLCACVWIYKLCSLVQYADVYTVIVTLVIKAGVIRKLIKKVELASDRKFFFKFNLRFPF